MLAFNKDLVNEIAKLLRRLTDHCAEDEVRIILSPPDTNGGTFDYVGVENGVSYRAVDVLLKTIELLEQLGKLSNSAMVHELIQDFDPISLLTLHNKVELLRTKDELKHVVTQLSELANAEGDDKPNHYWKDFLAEASLMLEAGQKGGFHLMRKRKEEDDDSQS
jgi:hypothetical protein